MGPCPMCFIVIFAAILSDYRHRVIGDKLYKNEENVGTVLFEKSDCGKHCWSSEEFAILNSRRMFQDILPRANVIDCQNDQYIALLMDYFHICLECVRKLSIGKTKHLMLKALADTMGGYLKVYILPLTKHSYYAGNIKYHNAKRLFDLFEELKNFLHTNGDGWRAANSSAIKRVKIPPIVIAPSKSTNACDGLITYSKAGGDNDPRNYHRYNFKRKRLTRCRRKHGRRSATDRRIRSHSESVTVPLPFLDDEVEPNSIALPFKKNNLQSLHSERSAFALVRYYVASVKCIQSKSQTKSHVAKFSSDFYEWLQKSVAPHLEDDKWYPAFGGVLRVMASLKESGYGSSNNNGKSGGGEYQVMPQLVTETTTKEQDEPNVSPLYNNGADTDSLTFGTTELIVIAVASALLVWLLVGLTLVCYRFLSKNSDECGPCSSPKSPPIAVLYENGEYCPGDECNSKILRKSIAQKLKEWWRKKFGKCPGGCDQYEDEERCLAAMSYTSKDTLPGSTSSKSVQKRQHSKSVSISRSTSPRGRRSFRKVCYSTDEDTMDSESPT